MHYKKSYGSMAEACKHGDGLAVVGAFIDVAPAGEDHQLVSADIMKLADVSSSSKLKNSSKILLNTGLVIEFLLKLSSQ